MAQASSKRPQHEILLAAAKAQRRIRIMYVLLALIFAGALAYLLVRVAVALWEAPQPVYLETEPVQVRAQAAEAPQRFSPESFALRADVSQLEQARDLGFQVLRAHDVRTEEDLERDRAGLEELDEESIERFRERVQEAERLLDWRYEYSAAMRTFNEALALSGVPYYEREIAQDGLDRARVFHTVVSGATPREQTHRLVRYTPPGAEPDEAVVGYVARDQRNWQRPSDTRIRLLRLENDSTYEFRLTSQWTVEELVGDALIEAKATRVHHHMTRLARLREEGLLTPFDLLDVAVLVLETGDFRIPGGDSVDANELAHACLAQAYDLCLQEGTSLTETVLVRRDPMFVELIRLQPRILAASQQLAGASRAERTRLEAEIESMHTTSRNLLTALVRRYPQAWDFRRLEGIRDAAELYERFREHAYEEADREAEMLGGDADRASEPPREAQPNERLQFFLERGARHMTRGYEQVRNARSGELSPDATRTAYQEALEQFFAARDYFRQAAALEPENRDISAKVVRANQEIHWTRREMSR